MLFQRQIRFYQCLQELSPVHVPMIDGFSCHMNVDNIVVNDTDFIAVDRNFRQINFGKKEKERFLPIILLYNYAAAAVQRLNA